MEDWLPVDDVVDIHEPRHCPAADGAGWVVQAWHLFKRGWLEFLLACVLAGIIRAAAGFVPLFGGLIVVFMVPLLTAGYLQMAHRARQDDDPEIGDLFAAFREQNRDRLTDLLLVGVAGLVFSVAALLVIAIAGVVVVFSPPLPTSAPLAVLLSAKALTVLIGLTAFLVLLMFYLCAVFYAVPLIWFGKFKVLEAMRMSLRACKYNVLPLTLYGFIALGLVLLSILTLGLGLLVVVPVLSLCGYTAFRRIFVDL